MEPPKAQKAPKQQHCTKTTARFYILHSRLSHLSDSITDKPTPFVSSTSHQVQDPKKWRTALKPGATNRLTTQWFRSRPRRIHYPINGLKTTSRLMIRSQQIPFKYRQPHSAGWLQSAASYLRCLEWLVRPTVQQVRGQDAVTYSSVTRVFPLSGTLTRRRKDRTYSLLRCSFFFVCEANTVYSSTG